jgi:Protein of unknown function (DUF3999)
MTSAVLAAALLAAAPTVERDIEVQGPGPTAVVLDRDVYDAARADLGDLRVTTAAQPGRLVPYVLDRGAATARRATPRVIDRGFTRGQVETATLDFGARAWKREVGLSLSGDNFRRRVVVEGSDDALRWQALTDTAYVFAVPGPPAARYESVAIPENEQRYMRVSVFHGDGDPERLEIRQIWASSAARREGPSRMFVAAMTREEDPRRRETLVTLDLGARHQPFRAIGVGVSDARFMRGVVVEARRDPPRRRAGDEPKPPYWVTIGEGSLYRYDDHGHRTESLRLDVAGRESHVRLRIRNGDDRPLDIQMVTVTNPVERLLFEASPRKSYRLTYGAAGLGPPTFDLARTMGDVEAWGKSARPAKLGLPRTLAEARTLPWTESHPALLWAGLILAVVLLGGLTWRALATSGPGSSS